jgi:CheY-like chemotaxis protein
MIWDGTIVRTEGANMTKRKILAIDDDPVTLRLLKVGLEGTGKFIVREEPSSLNALSAAVKFQPDAILLDICMPRMDGGDVAAQFEAHPSLRNVPICFLTSIVTPDEAGGQPMIRGDHKFLSKPIRIPMIVQHLDECLEGFRAASTCH